MSNANQGKNNKTNNRSDELRHSEFEKNHNGKSTSRIITGKPTEKPIKERK